jgi:nitroreductase
MTDFFDAVEGRHSVRDFLDKEVEDDKLTKILDACNRAPSAGDLQGYEIVVVKDEGKRKKIADAALGQSFVARAPVVLVFCANRKRSSSKYGSRGESLYCVQDATIAAAYAQLAATSLGLGSAWVGAFDENEVAELVGAPGVVVPVAIIPVGYPASEPSQTPRRDLSDLVHEEGF